VAAAAYEAHERGTWLACHARADRSVRMALKYEFDVIYHCDFIEGETFDLLEQAKDRIFLAPGIGIIYTTAYEAAQWGITREVAEHMENVQRCSRLRRWSMASCASVGCASCPAATTASPGTAGHQCARLRALRRHPGLYPGRDAVGRDPARRQMMDMGDELGLVKPGYLPTCWSCAAIDREHQAVPGSRQPRGDHEGRCLSQGADRRRQRPRGRRRRPGGSKSVWE